MGRACPLCPRISDVNLFRYRQGVIYLNAQIPDRALDFGMTEQELDSSKIARAPVDQGSLCASQGVRPKQTWIQPDAANPPRNKARILWATRVAFS